MPCTPLSYTPLVYYRNNLMERRRFRHQSRPLPRKGRTSWPRNAVGDFWRQEKLQSRFLLLLRSKVTSRLYEVRFPFQARVLSRTISALICCRLVDWEPALSPLNDMRLRRRLPRLPFEHQLCESSLDFVCSSVIKFHQKLALLELRS